MRLTYGIITAGGKDDQIARIVDTLASEGIPEYEIVVVGDCDLHRERLKIVPFDETQKRGWITKKKNIVTQVAKFPVIVYSHDYLLPCKGWYRGLKTFGDDWDLQMNKISNADGTRYRDWCLSPSFPLPKHRERERLLPYQADFTEYMYISGS